MAIFTISQVWKFVYNGIVPKNYRDKDSQAFLKDRMYVQLLAPGDKVLIGRQTKMTVEQLLKQQHIAIDAPPNNNQNQNEEGSI